MKHQTEFIRIHSNYYGLVMTRLTQCRIQALCVVLATVGLGFEGLVSRYDMLWNTLENLIVYRTISKSRDSVSHHLEIKNLQNTRYGEWFDGASPAMNTMLVINVCLNKWINELLFTNCPMNYQRIGNACMAGWLATGWLAGKQDSCHSWPK